jgi:Mn2+/Fe2+ NRAMP family transporter
MNGNFWKKLLAFSGPGLMVAVGYMDPGNWATDIAGGAKFGYTLLSVILISNFFAIILHTSHSNHRIYQIFSFFSAAGSLVWMNINKGK